MRSIVAVGALAVLLTSAVTAGAPPAADKIFADAKAECAKNEGTLEIAKDAQSEAELTGDGTAETIIDFNAINCSTLPVHCNTGGCSVFVVAGETATEFRTVVDWEIVDWNERKILLVQVPGLDCGGDKVDYCVQANAWTGSKFSAIARPD